MAEEPRPDETAPEVEEETTSPTEPEEELTEEEMRRMLEEQLEKVTVSQILQQVMVTLASIGYQKMGLPEEVNLKYRDLDQARLAIDAMEGIIKAGTGKMPDAQLEPFRSTLSNLKLNFVSISAKASGEPSAAGDAGESGDAEEAGEKAEAGTVGEAPAPGEEA